MQIREFLGRDGCALSAKDFEHQLKYIATDEARIMKLRAKWWPLGEGKKPKHPEHRWTRRTLERDAHEATKRFRSGKFDEYSAARYPQMCWYTHGTGLAGIRGISGELFPGIAAGALEECARFALIATEITLRHFRIRETATVEFAALEEQRTLAKANVLKITPADLGLR